MDAGPLLRLRHVPIFVGDDAVKLAACGDYNTFEISGRQLEHAGITDSFERRFSADETVKRHS